MTRININELLSETAHALRPVRVIKDRPRHYTATTFPKGERAGCERMLRMAAVTGGLGVVGDPLEDLWIDVLDVNGDILQEWPVNTRCFEFLRRKLRFAVEK